MTAVCKNLEKQKLSGQNKGPVISFFTTTLKDYNINNSQASSSNGAQ